METVEIKEFRVETLNPYKRFMDVSISYVARENGKITKRFYLNDTPLKFTESLLDEIRKTAGFEIENHDEMREKVGNIMIILHREINDLNKVKDHSEFMKSFNRINCYKAVFPDIEK